MSESELVQQFGELKQVYDARCTLTPKTKAVNDILLNPILFSQPLYSYEQAIAECWARLIEMQKTGTTTHFGREDLTAVNTILKWVFSLERKQITAEPLKNRQTPPMFMDS